MEAESSPAMKKPIVTIMRLSPEEEAQRLYEAREKAIRDENARIRTALNKGQKIGIEKGMEIGMEKGQEMAYNEIAINLIGMGLSNEQISRGTTLPISEIEKLRTSNNKQPQAAISN